MTFYNEYKYAVQQSQLSTILEILKSSYGMSDQFSSGVVDSVYYDDLSFKAFHQCQNGEPRKKKLRIRGYGLDFQQLHLKDKNIFGVSKLKVKIQPCRIKDGNAPELDSLTPMNPDDKDFPKIISFAASLPSVEPIIRVKYYRYRYRIFDYRFTLDTNIEVSGFSDKLLIKGAYSTLPHHVLEIKTEDERPHLPLFGVTKLQQISFSKFYLGICQLTDRNGG